MLFMLFGKPLVGFLRNSKGDYTTHRLKDARIDFYNKHTKRERRGKKRNAGKSTTS